MCAVSMVIGWGQQQWSTPDVFPPSFHPRYLELIERAKEYDKLNNQPDCPDESKDRWLKMLDQHMKYLNQLDAQQN